MAATQGGRTGFARVGHGRHQRLVSRARRRDETTTKLRQHHDDNTTTKTQGVCFPTEVVLLSACVTGGELHVLELSVTADEWKRGPKTLRQVGTP